MISASARSDCADMSLCSQAPRAALPPKPPAHLIEIIEPHPEDCPTATLPPEGNVKFRNYRFLNQNLRAYTPTGDIHTSPAKRKLVPRFDVFTTISPPRAKILELLRPEDPGRDTLEAIVRPSPRRGLMRPLDEDTRRFLERALHSPSPLSSTVPTPEPEKSLSAEQTESTVSSSSRKQSMDSHRSLAEELKEAEDNQQLEVEGSIKQDLLMKFEKRSEEIKEAFERERLGKLALSVEEDEGEEEGGLAVASRRLDALLAESRDLHEELAGIHKDIQAQSGRATRCAAAARALLAEARALRYVDDVVALLRGDVAAAARVRSWPFAIGRRQPGRNYVI